MQFSEELDPETSQNINNFTIPGVSINSAVLTENKRTVHLHVSNLSLHNDYTMYIIGVKDDAFPPNNQVTQSIAIDMPDPISFPLKINNAAADITVNIDKITVGFEIYGIELLIGSGNQDYDFQELQCTSNSCTKFDDEVFNSGRFEDRWFGFGIGIVF